MPDELDSEYPLFRLMLDAPKDFDVLGELLFESYLKCRCKISSGEMSIIVCDLGLTIDRERIERLVFLCNVIFEGFLVTNAIRERQDNLSTFIDFLEKCERDYQNFLGTRALYLAPAFDNRAEMLEYFNEYIEFAEAFDKFTIYIHRLKASIKSSMKIESSKNKGDQDFTSYILQLHSIWIDMLPSFCSVPDNTYFFHFVVAVLAKIREKTSSEKRASLPPQVRKALYHTRPAIQKRIARVVGKSTPVEFFPHTLWLIKELRARSTTPRD